MYRYSVKHLLSSVLLIYLFIPAGVGFAADDDRVYKIGIVPQYTPLFIYRNWRPLIARIRKETGLHIEIETYKDFKQFDKALASGTPDFTYLSPYHLVTARRSQPYLPLLRDDSRKLIGIVVVPKDSKVTSIKELDKQTLVFPSPNAFAASLYLRAYLHEKIGLSFIPEYVGTHGNVYRNVARKLSVAGGGVNSSLASQPERLQESLRVLLSIPGVAAHPVSVHERVPDRIRDRFMESFQSMHLDKQGRELLASVQIPKPVAADYATDYAFLESLKLEKYRVTKE